ncbi:MAG TPA: hypothetical protein VNR66_04170 [Solirubrobacteraceae bacterium]|nr:hypothetical protein [Solirubrobacteraceae bacterium]
MQRRLVLWALIVAMVALPALIVGASDARSQRPVGSEVLHLRFAPVGLADDGVLVSGPYAYVFAGVDHGVATGTLTDDRTGRRRSITSPAGCGATLMGGPWLLFTCQGSVMLHSLAGGAWRPVASLHVPVMYGVVPVAVAVGTSWIEFDATACETAPHCAAAAYVFESIRSGRVRSDPTNATTFADLDSPALARRVCSPLRVPKANVGVEGDAYQWAARPGTIRFYGSSVMANGRFRDGTTGLFLERCGSRLHRYIDTDIYTTPDVAVNVHMVIWQRRHDQLAGLWLPSLRRLVIPLPAAVQATPFGAGNLYGIYLSSSTLYALNEDGQLWKTRPPSR